MTPAAQPALQLRDIHLPAEPGLWPPALGWWVLATLLLILLVWAARAANRRYHLRHQRQKILAMLNTLEQETNRNATPEKIAQLSTLLRRLALSRYPRRRVAALTGRDWLTFLDESGGKGQFSHGPGQVLSTGPYQARLPAGLDTRALGALVRDWVKQNTGYRYES
ncbi:FIG00657500: hypothetical protein [hydrothermal vent metagenome]|uniref:DUF4381 domain-containing protein n=1 Tax=hydrothermal vent metagenome TaxID=652676 RepID=A0A3B0YK30_9ZZZZ